MRAKETKQNKNKTNNEMSNELKIVTTSLNESHRRNHQEDEEGNRDVQVQGWKGL